MSVSPKLRSKLKRAPLVLISPDTQAKGNEFSDASISLSEAYQKTLFTAGCIPVVLAGITSREYIAEAVRRCDGVLLTGGDDLNPNLYTESLPAKIRKTVFPATGDRDLRELMLVDEIFRQQKPLLGICRGHQIVNVALGGTLVADIGLQVPGAINHRRMDKKQEKVHEVQLAAGSLLASITGTQSLGVNSTHHQSLEKIADLLQVTAKSADGVVEGTELRPELAHLLPFFVTVQFHPERLATRHPEHQEIFNKFVRVCAQNSKSKL